ncbi:GntR family transcriptional regulator [Dactylosporangium sucinum]|nr:GntR family transcriptional regulator [Dactylosporangium sucinum]
MNEGAATSGRRTSRAGRSLVEQVTSQLREDIVTGRLAVGERLTELRLADAYGVSRVPVREALRLLEGEGFVTTTSPRIRTVTRMTREDAENLFEVRATVEGLAAARAAKRVAPARLRVIRAILAEGQDCVARGEIEVLPQLNTDLHRAIALASESTMLLGLFDQISHKISWFYADVVTRRAHSSWHEHAQIVAAIVEGDAQLSRSLMLEHIAASQRLTQDEQEDGADDGR